MGAGDDVPNGLHRLVGQRLALVAGDVHLHVSGLAVDALGAGRGQRIAPEVLDVLDVFGVGPQFSDHLVVERVRVRAQRIIALEHDHHRTAGVVLLKHLADAFRRDQRGRIVGTHRYRPQLAHLFELRHGGIEDRDDGDPRQDDRDREGADGPGQPWPGGVARRRYGVGRGVVDGGAHAAFTKQYVAAFTPSAVLSSFTTSSTTTRQPID